MPARELRQNSELEPFGLVVTEWWWWYGATPGGLRAREYGLPAGGRSRGLPILLLPGPPVCVLEPEVADELPEAAPFFLHPPAACHQLLIASSRAPSIVTAKSALISHLNALLTHIGMSLILSSSRGCEVRVQSCWKVMSRRRASGAGRPQPKCVHLGLYESARRISPSVVSTPAVAAHANPVHPTEVFAGLFAQLQRDAGDWPGRPPTARTATGHAPKPSSAHATCPILGQQGNFLLGAAQLLA